jgi:hypothetical protein
MADPTITSVDVQEGVLHIIGTGYTQTTTTVFVDGAETDHQFVSATELMVDPAPDVGSGIAVEKSGVRTDEVELEAAPASGETPPAAAAPKSDSIVSLSDDVDSAQKPYPFGNPPNPEDEFEKIHGFRRQL